LTVSAIGAPNAFSSLGFSIDDLSNSVKANAGVIPIVIVNRANTILLSH